MRSQSTEQNAEREHDNYQEGRFAARFSVFHAHFPPPSLELRPDCSEHELDREKIHPGCELLPAWLSPELAAERERSCHTQPGGPTRPSPSPRNAIPWQPAAARTPSRRARLYRCGFEPLRRAQIRGRDPRTLPPNA